MYKITKTWVDYNGNERTEDFYFHLKKSELMEMQMIQKGGMEEYIKRIIAAQDTAQLVTIFKDLIDKSYGVKTLDGRGFSKSPELLQAFKETEAYSDIFIELATDAEAASKFVNGVMPADLKTEGNKNLQIIEG